MTRAPQIFPEFQDQIQIPADQVDRANLSGLLGPVAGLHGPAFLASQAGRDQGAVSQDQGVSQIQGVSQNQGSSLNQGVSLTQGVSLNQAISINQ